MAAAKRRAGIQLRWTVHSEMTQMVHFIVRVFYHVKQFFFFKELVELEGERETS